MATLESFTIGGTQINDTTNFSLEALEMPTPAKRPEWVTGADADGATLVRDPLFDNRVITARVRVAKQASMDAALAKLGTIVDLLEEAERQQGGLACVWTPAGATKSVTFYCLSGEIDGLPVTTDGQDAGWFQQSPVIAFKLTCKPFGYGSEVTLSAASSSTPILTLTAAGVTGDVPAEARLIVTDGATRSRCYLEWGLEQRYYDAATSLLIDSDNLLTTGFVGTQTTRTGAYDANATGSSVIEATGIMGNVVGLCGTGDLSHVGTFRVKARVWASQSTVLHLRFSWREGAGSYAANASTSPPVAAVRAGSWVEVDLGLITVPQATLGTQRWSGKIEAYCDSGFSATVAVDYVVLVPAGEGYGKAKAVQQPVCDGGPTVSDDFINSTGSPVALTGLVKGSFTWAGAGDADDFQVTTANVATRTAVSDTSVTTGRYEIAGTTTLASTVVSVDHASTVVSGIDGQYGVFARYIDTNNWLRATIVRSSSMPPPFDRFSVSVEKRVAGTLTTIKTLIASFTVAANQWLTLRLVAAADGRWWVWLGLQGADLGVPLFTGYDSVLATGGALASGKVGIYDGHTIATATTRSYDNFFAGIPEIQAVLFAGRQAEIRHDSALHQDATGAFYGPVPSYRGSRFLLPPAGSAGRTSRVLVKAHRDDIEAGNADDVTDSLTAQIAYTPRFLAVPR